MTEGFTETPVPEGYELRHGLIVPIAKPEPPHPINRNCICLSHIGQCPMHPPPAWRERRHPNRQTVTTGDAQIHEGSALGKRGRGRQVIHAFSLPFRWKDGDPGGVLIWSGYDRRYPPTGGNR
jgi:hypothetical protein